MIIRFTLVIGAIRDKLDRPILLESVTIVTSQADCIIAGFHSASRMFDVEGPTSGSKPFIANEFVTTVTLPNFRRRIASATSSVVVPESTNTPSCITAGTASLICTRDSVAGFWPRPLMAKNHASSVPTFRVAVGNLPSPAPTTSSASVR